MQTIIALMVILFFSAVMALPVTKRGVVLMPNGINGMGRHHQSTAPSSVVNYSSNGGDQDNQSIH